VSAAARVLKWSCAVVWLALVAAVVLLAVEERLRVLHPAPIPLVLLLCVALGAAIVGLVAAGWQVCRASGQRSKALLWAGALVLPLVLFSLPFEQARRQWAALQVPHSVPGRLVIVAAASFMGAEATFYPRRIETDHLVMIFRELERPQLDAETMERHVRQLEAKVGAPLRAKIHWVRGRLLGQGNCSFLGLALGSIRSPSEWSGHEGTLDRHELAHAVIVQQRPASADPPMVLHEGWAESQSGATSLDLAARALDERQQRPELQVAGLFAPDWYHREERPVYTFGGALVDFLIRRFGVAKFVDLYNRCQPHTFEADIKAIYGQSLADLETAFWEEVRGLAG
jgi:hypothetical protein